MSASWTRAVLHSRNASYFLVGAAAPATAILAQLLAIPVVLHAVGLASYGLYGLFSAFTGLGSVLDFGLTSTIARFVARSSARPRLLAHVLATNLTVITLLAAAILFVCAIAAALIWAAAPGWSVQGIPGAQLVLVAGATIVPTLYLQMALATMRGSSKFYLAGACETAIQIANIAIPAAAAWMTRSILVLLLARFAVTAVAVGPLVSASLSAGNSWTVTTSLRYFRRYMAHFSGWVWTQSVVVFVGGRADQLIIASFIDLRTLGVYGLCVQLTGAVTGLASRGMGFMLPLASKAANQKALAARLFNDGTRRTAMLAALVAALICLASQPPLRLWLGNDLAHSLARPLTVLTWTAAGNIAATLGSTLAMALGRARLLSVVSTVSAGTSLVALTALGLAYGFNGVLLAKALYIPICVVNRTWIARAVFGERDVWFGLKALAPVLLGAVVFIPAVWLLYP